MSSSQRPERVVHQDYIAKIRYSNQLPPPPIPPKLLDIPGTGLSGGQYTSAGYASRLAREQPLNIEADAELGMHIDLVGIPGVFDGDERAIMAEPGPRTIHPADKQLLRPLATLGKPAGSTGGVSFLRRTEYAASSSPQMFASGSAKDLLRLRNDPKRRKANINKEDPINIARNIVKGFDIAHPKDAYKGEDSTTNLRGAEITNDEVRAWSHPKHPTKSNLQLLDSYPVLPDLEAIPDLGSYVVVKFITNPVAVSNRYDVRLDAAILRPVVDEGSEAANAQKLAEWDESSGKPRPTAEYDYDYFLPDSSEAPRGIKRKFDANDPEHDDPELYTDEVGEGDRAFKYTRVRTYETYNQHADPDNVYDDTVALALHDPETDIGTVAGAKSRLSKGAYFYPIIQRTALRPKRKVGNYLSHETADKIDEINLTVRDLDEQDMPTILEHRAKLDPTLKVPGAGNAVEATA